MATPPPPPPNKNTPHETSFPPIYLESPLSSFLLLPPFISDASQQFAASFISISWGIKATHFDAGRPRCVPSSVVDMNHPIEGVPRRFDSERQLIHNSCHGLGIKSVGSLCTRFGSC